MITVIELIKMLYTEGFFSDWKTVRDVQEKLKRDGFNFSDQLVLFSMANAAKKGILSRKTVTGRVSFSQKEPPQIKIRAQEIGELNKVLSEVTISKLGDKFRQEVRELHTAIKYDCGTSAAFLLRKILEKSIFYVFAKNNKIELLKDGNSFIGLTDMLNLCSQEKIKGVPILLPKTVKELSGIKFLCDSAAHDYLSNVEVSDINYQLPFWTVAIKELCDKF
jgi:hypothetical protein